MADTAYSTQSYRCEAGLGINARFIYDAPPKGAWLDLDNLESREEGALSSRFGLAALTTNGVDANFPLGFSAVSPASTLGRMQGIGQSYRYAATQAGELLRRQTDTVGAFTRIASGLSGQRVSMSPYRPANTSVPWNFVADKNRLLKDSGTLAAAQNWGIAAPTQPTFIAPAIEDEINIETFDEAGTGSFVLANIGTPAMAVRVTLPGGTPIIAAPGTAFVQVIYQGTTSVTRVGGVTTVTTFLPHGYSTGMRVGISNALDPTFNASSTVITVTGASTFTYVNPGANTTDLGNPVANPLPSFAVGMAITTTDVNVETVYITEVVFSGPGTPGNNGFVAEFARTHAANWGLTSGYLKGTIAANTTASVSKAVPLNLSTSATTVDPDNDTVQLFVLATNPLAIQQVTLKFDVGDGSFTQDYYAKAMTMSTAQPLVSGGIPAGNTQTSAVAQRAAGLLDPRRVGGNDPSLLPTDLPVLQQVQPSALSPGANVWTLITIRLGEFLPVGAAGNSGNDWSNVVGWQVQFKTQATLTTSIGIDDLIFLGGSDLDSFAGQAYDYRSTFYNINTGCESNPSVTMIASDPTTFNLYKGAFLPIPVAVQRQSIVVQPPQPTDLQVTHINIYRRGGTLTQAWYLVTQIPVGQLTFTDTIADSTILINTQLSLDNDPPVSSLLPTPLNTNFNKGSGGLVSLGPGLVTGSLTGLGNVVYPGQLVTIGTGSTQEQAYVQSVVALSVTIYLQFNHGHHAFAVQTPLTATQQPQVSMNLSAISYDQAWLAGDVNNPHFLYYSKPFQPETFPQANFIEVGTPDAPVMALVVLRGQLIVFTTKTVWLIYGGQGAVPLAVPTGVMHGLAANWAWAASENVVYYLSYDGIYLFTGSGSTYLTQNTEWIWTSRTETNGAQPNILPVLDAAQKSNVFMAYGDHELFVVYKDANGITHRQIAHDQYQRWRNDDQSAGNITAMNFEQDTGDLLVAKDDGMAYIDRVNDYDSGGFAPAGEIKNSINFSMQTPQLDVEVKKAYKVFNEVTIDATLPLNLVVSIAALFDSQQTTVALGTIVGTGQRAQYQVNINAGLGQRSLNMGLRLTGSTIGQAIFHEIHVRALVEAESRQSYDSYKLDFGSASFKFVKQGWFVYSAPDLGGIEMAIYLDDEQIPTYVFTLPQSLNRTTLRVRFPAMKFRIIRMVGTSDSPFQMYTQDTEIEVKLLDSQKGYTKEALST